MERLGTCAKCGFWVDKKHHVHSRYTGLWYCSDLDECHRRAQNDLTWNEFFLFAAQIEHTLTRGDHEAVRVRSH